MSTLRGWRLGAVLAVALPLVAALALLASVLSPHHAHLAGTAGLPSAVPSAETPPPSPDPSAATSPDPSPPPSTSPSPATRDRSNYASPDVAKSPNPMCRPDHMTAWTSVDYAQYPQGWGITIKGWVTSHEPVICTLWDDSWVRVVDGNGNVVFSTSIHPDHPYPDHFDALDPGQVKQMCYWLWDQRGNTGGQVPPGQYAGGCDARDLSPALSNFRIWQQPSPSPSRPTTSPNPNPSGVPGPPQPTTTATRWTALLA